MPTHKLTSSQLHGMIKEALEESVAEIALDDERMELARLGLSRTPEQNRRYKALLEAKLGYMNEISITGVGKQILGLFQSGKGKQLAGKIDDATLVKNILPLIASLIVQSGSTFDDFMATLKSKKTNLVALIKQEQEKSKGKEAGAPGVKTGSGAQEAALFNESRRR